MPDAQPRRSARKASVGNQSALLAHVHAFYIRRGIKHLLHARPAFRTFVCNDDAIALFHAAVQDALAGRFLTVEHHGRTAELPQRRVYAGRLDHAAVLCDVPEEHTEPAVFCISMFKTSDAALLAVGVELLPLRVLAPHLRGEAAAGRTVIDTVGLGIGLVNRYPVFLHRFGKRQTVHTLRLAFNQSAFVQLVHDAEYSACTVAFLHAIFLRIGRKHTEARHMPTQSVDVAHLEINPSFLCYGQQVEHRVRASAHGNVQGHGIEEGLARGNASREHALVSVFIIGTGIPDDLSGRIFEQPNAVLMRSQYRSVARQCKADSFGERVHRVGREHARTAAAARTGTAFNLCHLLVADRSIGTFDHSRDKVGILAAPSSCLHRSSRAEHGRNVQAHRSHEHARRHLVAVGYANHRVGLVGIHHVFHRVGNDIARRKRIEHAVVSHRNAVVDGYRIELCGIAACLLYLLLYDLSDFM